MAVISVIKMIREAFEAFLVGSSMEGMIALAIFDSLPNHGNDFSSFP